MRNNLVLQLMVVFSFVGLHVQASEICPVTKKLSIFQSKKLKKKNYVIYGRTFEERLLLGKKEFDFSGLEVKLVSTTNSLEMSGKRFVYPAVFRVETENPFLLSGTSWKLNILNEDLEILAETKGSGKVPEKIIWNKNPGNRKIIQDKSYFYTLSVSGKDFSFTTAPKPFIIYSVTTLSYKIPVKILSNYERMQRSSKLTKFLEKLSQKIKKYPDKKWNIVAFVTDENPSLCDGVYRLRNYFTVQHEIPLKSFHTFCEFVKGEEKQTKFVKITGTKPREKVKLLEAPSTDELTMKVNGEELNTESGLFLLPIKRKLKTYQVDMKLKSGGKFSISVRRSKILVRLKKGENKVKGTRVLLNEGSTDIYCGEPPPKKLKFSVGIGPYFVSTSLIPKNLHLPAINLSLKKDFTFIFPKLARFIKLHPGKFVILADFLAAPSALVKPTEALKSFYKLNVNLGYKITTKSMNIIPFIGYSAYFSGENHIDGRNLIKNNYNMTYGIIISQREKAGKISFSDTLKVLPFLYMSPLEFEIENSLKIKYQFDKSQNVYIEHRKSVYYYKLESTEEKGVESKDMIFLGYGKSL